VEGYFFAGLGVTLVQYLRRRDRRLLPLMALFAALAAAETREEWDPWQDGLRLVAGGAALVLVALLSRDRGGAPAPGSGGQREVPGARSGWRLRS